MICTQNISSPFIIEITTSILLSANSTFILELRNMFINPQSTKSIGSFDLTTYNSLSY